MKIPLRLRKFYNEKVAPWHKKYNYITRIRQIYQNPWETFMDASGNLNFDLPLLFDSSFFGGWIDDKNRWWPILKNEEKTLALSRAGLTKSKDIEALAFLKGYIYISYHQENPKNEFDFNLKSAPRILQFTAHPRFLNIKKIRQIIEICKWYEVIFPPPMHMHFVYIKVAFDFSKDPVEYFFIENYPRINSSFFNIFLMRYETLSRRDIYETDKST